MFWCMMTNEPAGSRKGTAPCSSSGGGVVEKSWEPGMASDAAETTVCGSVRRRMELRGVLSLCEIGGSGEMEVTHRRSR
jgi:hypothetical protein